MAEAKNIPVRNRPRTDLPPIFVHSEIDDLNLSLGAFRVYAHLARRAGADNLAWPSYNTIGEKCFRASYPKAKEATLRRKAIAAVNELKKHQLIEVQHRHLSGTEGNTSNAYQLVSLAQWRRRSKQPNPLSSETGADTAPSQKEKEKESD